MPSDVIVILKVYPEDPTTISNVERAIRTVKSGVLQDIRREPIAFGLELIRVAFRIPDKVDGALERLENEISSIKGVNQVEVEGATLI